MMMMMMVMLMMMMMMVMVICDYDDNDDDYDIMNDDDTCGNVHTHHMHKQWCHLSWMHNWMTCMMVHGLQIVKKIEHGPSSM